MSAKVTDREIMEVSTVVRDGDREVVRKQPFAHVRMLLAAAKKPQTTYPEFDPLKIFAAENQEAASSVRTGLIYGADIDSEISLRTVDFPLEAPGRPYAAVMTLDEAEQTVRTNGSVLTDGTVQLASLNYVDPRRVVLPSGRTPPTIYDGIYRAGIDYGMPIDMIGRVIHMLASNVDFKAKLHPTDTLEAFFSVVDETGKTTADSELLYLEAKFGSNDIRLYRYQHPDDGSIDYYDAEGRSTKLFLLRNPVPNGKFRSSFGMRRHPILKYRRMHTGVDWSAPRGTPIIASGNGKVVKAGWDSGGYGKQTLIQHANGYVSSYNHQSKIANGVVPGARVRQGQVIGYVGSTGLSTGPHLH